MKTIKTSEEKIAMNQALEEVLVEFGLPKGVVVLDEFPASRGLLSINASQIKNMAEIFDYDQFLGKFGDVARKNGYEIRSLTTVSTVGGGRAYCIYPKNSGENTQ